MPRPSFPPRTRGRRRVVGAGAALLLLAGCSAAAGSLATDRVAAEAKARQDASAEPERPTRLQLVVSPHPDDEMEAWSQVERSPDVFTVWLTMTRGEATAHCDPSVHTSELDVAAGEVPPSPPPEGAGTASCADARMASWTTFLRLAWPGPTDDATASTDADADADTDADAQERTVEVPERATLPASRQVHLPPVDASAGLPAAAAPTRGGNPSSGALAWSDPGMAMVALDAGDGEVTPDEVVWGVRAVLAQRGRLLPDLPLSRVVAAAYVGELPDAPYQHPDHLAVTGALLDPALTRALAPADGTFVVTGAHDPRASTTSAVEHAEYRRLMGLGPDVVGDDGSPVPLRLGLAQRVYGWLAFPGGWWPRTERAVPDGDGEPLIMARVQSFVHVPGPPP